MDKIGINSEIAIKGISEAFWPGRLEIIELSSRKIIIDCAHNSHGTASLKEFLDQYTLEKISLIYGTLDLKDWAKSLNLLIPKCSSIAYFRPDSIRSLDGSTISDFLDKNNFQMKQYRDFNEDYHKIINHINGLPNRNVVLITGSIYLIGKLRSILDIPLKKLWNRKIG